MCGMAELLYRLGRFSARRAWVVVVAWAAILGLAGGAYLIGAGTLSSSFDIPGTPTAAVTDRLVKKLPDFSGASGAVVFRTRDGSPLSTAQREKITALGRGIATLGDVANVIDPFTTETQRATQTETVRTALSRLAAAQSQLDAGRAQLDAAVAEAKTGGYYDGAKAALDAQQAALAANQKTLDDNLATATAGERLLDLSKGIRTVSGDGSTAILNVGFDKTVEELSPQAKTAVLDYVHAHPVAGVETAISSTIAQTVPEVIGVGEITGVILAGLVLFVMLGTLIAAGLPLLTALVGVGVGVLFSLSLSGVLDEGSISPVLGVMLGLAVGIDYALFIINRHRRQLRQGVELHESIGLATGTAGNAVVFAGSTVIVALLALNVTGIPFIGVMGTVGAICIAVAVLVAVTLTPAMLRLVGPRILPRRARAAVAAAPAPVTVRPMSTLRAALTVVVAAGVLLVVAIPALSMRLGLPDASSDPIGSTTQRAFSITEKSFGAGANGPLVVTAALPAGTDAAEVTGLQLRVAESIDSQGDVAAVAPIGVSSDRSLAAFEVVLREGPNSVSTGELVQRLRATTVGGTVGHLGVAGQASGNIDISDKLAAALPVYVAVVVGLSLIILIAVFRSILVPLIAIGGFILSLLATYGVLVAVFQWGWLATVFGIHSTGPVLNFLPIILVGILFGLAMDYQLFLATGMREAWVHGAAPREAVVRGFRAGRTVVTAAAIIMISVFGGFIFSDSVFIVALGLGLAFGVLADAFVVRLLLMPALMHLLGGAAWWIPRWLDRVLPDLDVEGARLEREHHAV